ncbi:MAG TPA: cadmium resistance transporter [Cyclobacteriaceae bacterium]|jgi:cadmium resistance protein CadD (predicted permease)|nr:cadmium resistance transporter [Cyclobacteriaceae bacterium]
MIETIVTAIFAFASTNIDDIFILMTLFTQVSTSLTGQHIMRGQYLGIITLTVLSIAGSLIGIIIPEEYIGFLGLFPIYLGVMKIYHYFKNEDDSVEIEDFNTTQKRKSILSTFLGVQTLSIAAITIANGGDNIGVYVPLFVNLNLLKLIITVSIFLILVYVWVRTAEYATSHPALTANLKKYNHIIFPLILIGLGIYILASSGTLALLKNIFNS